MAPLCLYYNHAVVGINAVPTLNQLSTLAPSQANIKVLQRQEIMYIEADFGATGDGLLQLYKGYL